MPEGDEDGEEGWPVFDDEADVLGDEGEAIGDEGDTDEATCASCGCAVRSPGMCGPCVDNGGTPPPGFAFLQPIDEPLQETSVPAIAHPLALVDVPATALVDSTADVIARFLDSCASAKTQSTMRQSLNRAARMMGGKVAEDIPWTSLRYQHTDALRAALLRAVQENRYRMATVKITLTAVKGLLVQAVRMGVMQPGDFASATMWRRIPKHERLPVGREIPTEEIDRLLIYCEEVGGAYGAWLKATFALLLGTALRSTEACQMPIEAYDVAGRCVRLIRKGGKENIQPLGEREARALDAWLPIRMGFQKRLSTRALLVRVHKNDWVWPTSPLCNVKILENVFIDVAAKAGIPRFAPHDLRRTFCTRGLDQGVDLRLMQMLMGHASSDTTGRYDKRGDRAKAEARAKISVFTR